ncbi:TPA: hypothetical protein RY462_002179 [Escherichia albertii]|uniref:hypothetical protein n=1 Tax=Escherichia albertii TaxID=208962 RepID=UPI00290A15E0|nr:hypothetical protein [Escherichia albertii]WOA26975.1 hypothetical protein RXE34_01405 [Escherichia albertii]HEB1149941.1 hypothetical protein [Escherichia albertii]HEB1188406.1 hypothetical protein [Escherichia albertii]HEB1583026.1 hypothetical protein [Escherichia albertii]HEB1602157.1 hypothetical protein [Escherichia albertii]
MAHELIEKWSFPAQAETEEEKEKRLLEFWKAMDAASFWVEVEELEAGKLGLIKSNAESIDTPFFQVYIGEEKGIKPPVLQSSLVPFREAAGDALLNIASTGEVGCLSTVVTRSRFTLSMSLFMRWLHSPECIQGWLRYKS